MRRALLGLAGLLGAFVATTWWALESGGVAIVGTRTPAGDVRSTHVWYVEPDGELWLEAGSPGNGWYRDVSVDPVLTFETDGVSRRYVAEPLLDESGHLRIREWIREKYGFRDWWINLVIDTSESIAVRLVPDDERAGEAR